MHALSSIIIVSVDNDDDDITEITYSDCVTADSVARVRND